jgi:hypothetical protein
MSALVTVRPPSIATISVHRSMELRCVSRVSRVETHEFSADSTRLVSQFFSVFLQEQPSTLCSLAQFISLILEYVELSE